MLVIKDSKVYRLSADTLTKLSDDPRCKDGYENTNNAVYEFGESIKDECVSELEFTLRLRMARMHDPEIHQHLSSVMDTLWMLFTELNKGDVSKFMLDMAPEDVEINIHNEPGMGYDLDNHRTIECKDCQVKTDAYLTWVDRAKKLRDIDPKDITEEVIVELMSHAPDMGLDGPPLGIAIQVEGGYLMIGVKPNDGPEFDEALPTPTHSGGRVLN